MNRKNHIILLITVIITGATLLGSAMRASAEGMEAVLSKSASGYAGYFDELKGVGSREAITWTYDAATKTLTFSGSGGMAGNQSAKNLFDDEGNENLKKWKSGMSKELGTWYAWYNEAEHVVIGEGITDISEYAFYNFKELKDISLPSSLLYIEANAFNGAWIRFNGAWLRSIVIPGSVKKIGAFAFEDTGLKEITIENGVEEIDVGAFRNNKALEEIIFPESVKFVTYDSKQYDAGDFMLYDCDSLKRVTLPSTMTAISDYFFYGCISLETVFIPQSVEKIGSDAFFQCECLERVIIPPSVEEIGWGAFSQCESLKKVVIPSSVKTIDVEAFSWCESLKKIVIPSSVEKIEPRVFSWCENLEKVVIPPSVKTIEEEAFCGCENLKKVTLPPTIEKIKEYAFAATNLKSIKLPKSLEKLGAGAFNGTSIKTIEIPPNVKVLGTPYGYGVFPNNKKLKTVVIKSKKIKTVYKKAFDNFPSKAVITVPKGKKKSYSKMFYKAGLSKKVKIKESKKW